VLFCDIKDLLAVQPVMSELVSADFPVKQGKNREYSGIWPANRRFIWSKRLSSLIFLPNSLNDITGNYLSRTGNFWPETGNLLSLLPGTRKSRAISHLLGTISGALDIGMLDPATRAHPADK
jgi:hypothetical protein